MLFWSIGKFKVVELGYMTPPGSLENLGPKQKGKESPSWGHPCGLQGFVLCGCAVWAQGFIHSRCAAQPPFPFLSVSWIDTSKKRVTAHMGIYCSKGGYSFPCPPYSGLAEPTQDPGFPTGALCVSGLWLGTVSVLWCCCWFQLLWLRPNCSLQRENLPGTGRVPSPPST